MVVPRACGALIVALVAAVSFASTAAAQNDLTYNVPDFTTPYVTANLLRPAAGTDSGTSGTRRKATRKELRALRFRPSAARTGRIDAKVTQDVKDVSPESVHPTIERLIADGTYRRALDGYIKDFGGSPTNFADRTGTALLLMTALYARDNGDGTSPVFYPREVTGGRRYLRLRRDRLAKRSRVRQLSDARMQEAADRLGIIAVHCDSLRRVLAGNGYRSEAAELKDAIAARAAADLGVRLRSAELTELGLDLG